MEAPFSNWSRVGQSCFSLPSVLSSCVCIGSFASLRANFFPLRKNVQFLPRIYFRRTKRLSIELVQAPRFHRFLTGFPSSDEPNQTSLSWFHDEERVVHFLNAEDGIELFLLLALQARPGFAWRWHRLRSFPGKLRGAFSTCILVNAIPPTCDRWSLELPLLVPE